MHDLKSITSVTLHICHEGLQKFSVNPIQAFHVYENCWGLLKNMELIAPFSNILSVTPGVYTRSI